MGVRNTQPFKNTLNGAIFTPTAMKCVKDNIWGNLDQTRCDIAASIDLDRLPSAERGDIEENDG